MNALYRAYVYWSPVSDKSRFRGVGQWTNLQQIHHYLYVPWNDAFRNCLHVSDIFVCILNDHSLVTWPLFPSTSCCPNTSHSVSGQRTVWVDVSSLKWKKKNPGVLWSNKKPTATKAPPSNTYHSSFPTALSNTMKHLQNANSVNTFPECGVLETEKTEGTLVCCLVGK